MRPRPSDVTAAIRGEKFPRRCRITRRGDFHRVFARGRRVRSPELRLVVRRNDFGTARLGLAVSRKVGNAVFRNLLKRRLREIFRRERASLDLDLDIVVIPTPEVRHLDFARLRAVFLRLLSEVAAKIRDR